MRLTALSNRFMLVLLLACASVAYAPVAFSPAAHAEDTMHPGFRTLGLWLPETDEHIDIAIWYPSTRAPSDIQINEWSLSVARNGKPIPGRFPLIILSHGTAGSRFSHNDTAAALASSGFVVVAPTHPGDNLNDTSRIFTATQMEDRPRQVSQVIDHILRDPASIEQIDPNRIGMVGFGVGGSTALQLAGASPDGSKWGDYCAQASPSDPYCTPWAAARLSTMSRKLGSLPQRTDPRIRVVVAVAPAYGMFFSPKSLSGVRLPVFILKAENDEVNRAPFHADALRAALPATPEFSVLAKANHFSLMAACSPAMEEALPEICSTAPEKREAVHANLNAQVTRFLLSHIGDASAFPDSTPAPVPAVVPAPAVPSDQTVQTPEAQANGTRAKGNRKQRSVKPHP